MMTFIFLSQRNEENSESADATGCTLFRLLAPRAADHRWVLEYSRDSCMARIAKLDFRGDEVSRNWFLSELPELMEAALSTTNDRQ